MNIKVKCPHCGADTNVKDQIDLTNSLRSVIHTKCWYCGKEFMELWVNGKHSGTMKIIKGK